MWIMYYEGFESIEDLLNGYDIEDAMNVVIPDAEGADWKGTLKVTVEYFPEGVEDEDSR